MNDEAALRARMDALSTDELIGVCTTDAGDYTTEAIAIAREVLAARGADVAELSPSEPRPARADRAYLGGVTLVLGLAAALVYAPLSTDLPGWANTVIMSGIAALLSVAVFAMFTRR